jgi:Predicted metal-sulfur cluster biosynthetic enzyme
MDNPMAKPQQKFTVPEPKQHTGIDLVENGNVSGEEVIEALKDVIDPELGINIVDLGLVYGIGINEDNAIKLNMTLTSAACPLTDVIERQAEMVLGPYSTDITINWVWLPPWGPECITDDGRAQLRAIGFNV